MSDEYVDPSGNTEAFRSFAQVQPEAAPSRLPLVIGVLVVAVLLIALVVFLMLG